MVRLLGPTQSLWRRASRGARPFGFSHLQIDLDHLEAKMHSDTREIQDEINLQQRMIDEMAASLQRMAESRPEWTNPLPAPPNDSSQRRGDQESRPVDRAAEAEPRSGARLVAGGRCLPQAVTTTRVDSLAASSVADSLDSAPPPTARRLNWESLPHTVSITLNPHSNTRSQWKLEHRQRLPQRQPGRDECSRQPAPPPLICGMFFSPFPSVRRAACNLNILFAFLSSFMQFCHLELWIQQHTTAAVANSPLNPGTGLHHMLRIRALKLMGAREL